MRFRDLGLQYQALRDRLDAGIVNVCKGGDFILGGEVGRLEDELAAYVGRKHCIACANGTDALTLALMAWGVKEGDAVFVPDFTFFATGEVVSLAGATPVFVDVLPDTFNIDPARLKEAVERVKSEGVLKPRAVIPVDLFGLPADYDAIEPICERYGLLLLEDAAQGFGGAIRGKRACSFGDISTTSFFPAKPLGCYGDGGAVFTDDAAAAALIRSIALHGKGAHKYDNVRLGINSRLDTLQAAVLLVKLDAFRESELEAVQRVAQWYAEALRGLELIRPRIPDGYLSSYAQYTVRLAPGSRERVMERMRAMGVPVMIYYPKPMHAQKAFEGAGGESAFCPVTEELCAAVMSLPMHPYMTREQVLEVAGALRRSI